MRDAAGIDDRDVGSGIVGTLDMTVGDKPLAHFLRIGVGHLAPEKTDGESRHRPDATAPKTAFHLLS
jgi:hypothetical protein